MENQEKVVELLQGQIQKLDEIGNDLTPWETNTNRILRRAFSDPNIDVYNHRSYSLDGDNSYAKRQLKELLNGYILEIKELGLPIVKESNRIGNQINISNNINISIIIETLKQELSGKQISDLRSAYENGGNAEEKKNNVLAVLKKFGSDVASNILANILTNPVIFSSL